MTKNVLVIIIKSKSEVVNIYPYLDNTELGFLQDAKDLFDIQKYDYAIIAIWNAAINFIRRRIESFSIELWSITSNPIKNGRNNYNPKGNTLAERWEGVDDFVLIEGAKRLGVISSKVTKILETINWMRNHVSAAHISDDHVNEGDIQAIALMIQENLFSQPLPQPTRSMKYFIANIKSKELDQNDCVALGDEFSKLKQEDIANLNGFFIDCLRTGEQPTHCNVRLLFPTLWQYTEENTRNLIGEKFDSYYRTDVDEPEADREIKTRLFEMIIILSAVKYIPQTTRSRLYFRAAEILAKAKDKMYGWDSEVKAAKILVQLGTDVPATAFHVLYQEILAIWCGNFWGRSSAFEIFLPFIEVLSTEQYREVARMFQENDRVKYELSEAKPKQYAISLLTTIKSKLVLESHKSEIDDAIEYVSKL